MSFVYSLFSLADSYHSDTSSGIEAEYESESRDTIKPTKPPKKAVSTTSKKPNKRQTGKKPNTSGKISFNLIPFYHFF